MNIEQIKRANKVISILMDSDITDKIYSIDFNNEEFKIYAKFDRQITAYLKEHKYKTSVMDTGTLWNIKTIAGINIMIVLW